MEAARKLLSSPPSFPSRTHLKNDFSFSSSSVSLLNEQTAPAVSSAHMAPLSRHFPASVLLQEPRDEYRYLPQVCKDDRTSQMIVNKNATTEEDFVKAFEKQLLQSAGLWNLLSPLLTDEKQSTSVTSPKMDVEPCDAVALAKKALSASKQAALLAKDNRLYQSGINDALGTSSSDSLLEERIAVRSRRRLERRTKNRRTPKSKVFDIETYTSQKANVQKKLKEGFDSDDPLRLFLWGPETRQLLSAKEESKLIVQIQDMMRLEKVKIRFQAQHGREPTIVEWSKVVGLSCVALKSELHRGRSSREKLINANLRMVVHIAKQYLGRGLNLQDLLQEGSMGLMKSVEKFKPQAGCRFATYAYWWIRQTVRKAIFLHSRTIRLPENVYTLLGKVSDAKRLCIQEGNHFPAKEEIARRVGITTEKLEKLLFDTRVPLSMQQTLWGDQDTTLQEITADTGIETTNVSVEKQLMRNHVKNLLKVLSPRERKILRLRFGIEDGKEKSLSQVGEMYGLSKERVRQLESRALYRLKQSLSSHGLGAYTDLLV